MSLPLQILALLAIGIGVFLVFYFLNSLRGRKQDTHTELVLSLMQSLGYQERINVLGNAHVLVAQKDINGVNVTLDFGLSVAGFEVVSLTIPLEGSVDASFELVSKNYRDQIKTRGLGDDVFDRYFACTMNRVEALSFVSRSIRDQMVSLAEHTPRFELRLKANQLVIECERDVGTLANSGVQIVSFVKAVEKLASTIMSWTTQSNMARLIYQIMDESLLMSWRLEAARIFWITCKDASMREHVFMSMKALDVPELTDVAYLYATEQFDPALWTDMNAWASMLIEAIESTQQDEVRQKLGRLYFETHTLEDIAVFQVSSNRHICLVIAAIGNVSQDTLLAYVIPKILDDTTRFSTQILTALNDAQIRLPMSVIDVLITRWRQYSQRALTPDDDELPGLLSALMLWSPELVEAQVCAFLPYPTQHIRRMVFDWLAHHGSQHALAHLHAFLKTPSPTDQLDRAREVISTIMSNLHDLPQGGLSLSSVDNKQGQLSMLNASGEMTLIETADVQISEEKAFFFEEADDIVLEPMESGQYTIDTTEQVSEKESSFVYEE